MCASPKAMLKEQRLWEKFIPDMSIINIHNGKEANAEKKERENKKDYPSIDSLMKSCPKCSLTDSFFKTLGRFFSSMIFVVSECLSFQSVSVSDCQCLRV